VPYQPDITAALQELRQREFQAGRYYPWLPFLEFPTSPQLPSPGAQHASIEEACEEADADGTRSILDLDRVSAEPDFGAVTPLNEGVLQQLYGTTRSTRGMIEHNRDFFEDIESGHGIYIAVYQERPPDEIFFAGYSYE
jgi:hypothetical protein